MFLVFYFEAWDSLDAIYRVMLADSRFEPSVVTIPRKLTGYEDFSDLELINEFFTSRGIDHVSLDYPDGWGGNKLLRNMNPDYIFLNYPWQRNYQPGYQIEQLREFTKVCYVPYFSTSLVQEPGVEGVALHQYTQPTHEQADLVFLQDEETKAAFDTNGRAEHAFLVGTPKIDALISARSEVEPYWPLDSDEPQGDRRLRVLWAPHHTYAQRWLNFGHFVDQKDLMLEYAATHPEIDVVFRPHPFLFGTMTDREVMTPNEVEFWQARWNALPNTYTDVDIALPAILLASDVLVTDGVSFLVEYPLVTGKPCIFWEKPDHWEFSRLGHMAAEASIRVESFSEVVAAIALATRGQLPSREEAITALFEEVRPYPTESAQVIVELVAADFTECSVTSSD